jgi:hypothetical protein
MLRSVAESAIVTVPMLQDPLNRKAQGMGNTARMTKGFRRIGIVLAAPLLAMAFLLVGFGAVVEVVHYFEQKPQIASPKPSGLKEFKADPSKSTAQQTIDLLSAAIEEGEEEARKAEAKRGSKTVESPADWGAIPVPGPEKPSEFLNMAQVDSNFRGPDWSSLLLWSSALAMSAALVYLACWSVGWIFAGFAND